MASSTSVWEAPGSACRAGAEAVGVKAPPLCVETVVPRGAELEQAAASATANTLDRAIAPQFMSKSGPPAGAVQELKLRCERDEQLPAQQIVSPPRIRRVHSEVLAPE